MNPLRTEQFSNMRSTKWSATTVVAMYEMGKISSKINSKMERKRAGY